MHTFDPDGFGRTASPACRAFLPRGARPAGSIQHNMRGTSEGDVPRRITASIRQAAGAPRANIVIGVVRGRSPVLV